MRQHVFVLWEQDLEELLLNPIQKTKHSNKIVFCLVLYLTVACVDE